ncbi:MAG: ACP S-malonyltransferase [Verrucomicrobia bacterium]|nr:ACP S-malonyltransferase [Verrucomicrobiota bacterium]
MSNAPAPADPAAPVKIALLFSGQGAQAVGMGESLAAASPAAAALIDRANATLERPLSRLMFAGPLEELTLTGNCQPALFVHGLAALAALRERLGGRELPVAGAAGLSLGEWTAHAAAGTFDFPTALRLVEKRGQFMEEACAQTAGAMAALIGAEEKLADELAAECEVDVANVNAPGQIVLSGEATKIALAVERAKERGLRRVAMLNVAGAYHSRLMDPAYLKLGEELVHTILRAPQFPVIANVTAQPAPTDDFDELRRTLVEQVTSTVRWSASVEYLIDELGCNLFLELGPGEVLAGLARRIRKGTEVLSVGDAPSLDRAVERLLPVVGL